MDDRVLSTSRWMLGRLVEVISSSAKVLQGHWFEMWHWGGLASALEADALGSRVARTVWS